MSRSPFFWLVVFGSLVLGNLSGLAISTAYHATRNPVATTPTVKVEPVETHDDATAIIRHRFWSKPPTAKRLEEIVAQFASPGAPKAIYVYADGDTRDYGAGSGVVVLVPDRSESRGDFLARLLKRLDEYMARDDYQKKYNP